MVITSTDATNVPSCLDQRNPILNNLFGPISLFGKADPDCQISGSPS